jgi:hypothetical protein
MDGHNETTANAPSEPKLCKMGCGFFGSNATGDCCSKCWNAAQRKERGGTAANTANTTAATTVAETPVAMETESTAAASAAVTSAAAPMEVESSVSTASFAVTAESAPAPSPAAAASPLKKRKKKKTSYKNMLAGMMEGSGTRDVEKEKESIQRVTGGGAFSKIDKI